MKAGRIAALVAGAVIVLCLIGGVILAVTNSGSHPAAVPATAPPFTASAPAPSASGPRRSIGGNDVVHVGEDVPAGTYRAATAVTPDSGCYWLKSRDAEGADIIANGLPAGGRPEVVLTAGQWFTSSSCPEWVKR